MLRITIGGPTFFCQPDGAVLETLLRENIRIPDGCRQGFAKPANALLDNSPPVLA